MERLREESLDGEEYRIKEAEVSTQRLEQEESLLEKKADEFIEVSIGSLPPEKIESFKIAAAPIKERFKKELRKLLRAAMVGTALLTTLPPGPRSENLEEARKRAKIELLQSGITAEQKEAYVLGFNNLIYKAIVPRAYTPESYNIGAGNFHQPREVVDEHRFSILLSIVKRGFEGLEKERYTEEPQREDAWRLYLGLSQKNNSFGISDHVPTHSKETKYYYKFNDPLFLFRLMGTEAEKIKFVAESADFYERSHDKKYVADDPTVLGHFQWSKGKDEKGCYLAYYDKWDLNVPFEKGGFFGQPFEIYDRIYYDPVTFERIF